MKTKSLLFTLIMMLSIVKISSAQIMFQKTYGKENWNEGFSVELTSDSGFIFAGYTKNIYDITTNAYLIKTNESGDTLWTKLYRGTHYNYGLSVQQTTDGGFIMGTCYGGATLNAYLIKTNSNGDTLWTKGYGGILDDNINSVQQTTDGGYIILGTTKSFGAGASDIYVIKTDFKGDTIWTKAYGGTNMEDCASIRQTDDDGYIIAGFTNSFGAGNTDVYVIKIDSNGAVMWSKTYGSHTVDYGRSAMQTSDGGYIIAGF